MIHHWLKQIFALPTVFPTLPRRDSRRYRFGRLCLIATLLAGMSLPLLSPKAYADEFNPPDRGLPGRRKGGGTRNPRSQCVNSDQVLTALLPASNLGLTISDYPQIFWFVPQNKAAFLEISLYATNSDFQDTNLLFLSQFRTSGEPGLGQFKVPGGINFSPLVEGQTYHWYVSLICDMDDRSQDIIVSGWLERVPMPAELKNLKGLAGVDRYRALAKNGIWFDAVDTLAQLECNPSVQADEVRSLWKNLMSDNQVNLTEFTNTPWLKSCSPSL